MCRSDCGGRCPLTMLAKQYSQLRSQESVCPCRGAVCHNCLADRVERYFSTEPIPPPFLRDAIFFRLHPLVLKILRRYCRPHPACRQSCVIGDLHSDMYVAFTEYLDQFDASRQVSFLSYIFDKLSWRAFNSFAREQRIRTREILLDEERDESCESPGEAISLESSLIAALDLERYLASMQGDARSLCLRHYFDGYSYGELAIMDGRREATIRQAVSRACRCAGAMS